MIKGKIALQVFGLLSTPSTRNKAARLLYLLSFDRDDRDSYADEGAAQHVAKLLSGAKCASVDLGSLMVNISLNDHFALQMAKPKLVGRIIDKLVTAADAVTDGENDDSVLFVLKALRNVATYTYNLATMVCELLNILPCSRSLSSIPFLTLVKYI